MAINEFGVGVSTFFAEAECPPKGHEKRPRLQGSGLQIVQHLYAEFPSHRSPKQIAFATRKSHDAVKKWLRRKTAESYVVQGERGWYRARATVKLLAGIGLEPLKVHALQVQMSPKRGSPSLLQGLGDRAEFRGRRVTFQPSKGGVMASIRASTDPLSAGEFQDLVAWLEGVGQGCGIEVRKADFGVDVRDHVLRLDGVEAVTLQAWNGAYLKAYNKQVVQATRFEACFHRLDLEPGEVVNILQGIGERPSSYEPPALDYEGGMFG